MDAIIAIMQRNAEAAEADYLARYGARWLAYLKVCQAAQMEALPR